MFSCLRRGSAFYRNVVSLALPILLQNLITTSLGMIDTFMVGTLGEAPLAAVAQANIPVFIIQLVIFGLQSGSSVLISQYWGKGDTDAINRVMGIGLYFALAISSVFAVVMTCFPVELMSLLTDNQELIPLAARYARIVGLSYLFNSVTGVYVGAHRSMENPKLGLIIFAVSMGTNTFLNWVLIFGNLGAPRLGVEGAALATLISRIVEFAAMAAYALCNKRFRLKPQLMLRPNQALLKKFLRFGTPVVLNETLWGLGTSMYKVIMGHMEGSKEILAARAITGNIEDVTMVAVFAIAGTAAIIVGREIGAGRRSTVYEVAAALNLLSVLCGVVIGGVLLLSCHTWLPALVYPVFHLSPEAGRVATLILTFVSIPMPLRAFDTTNTVGVLRGGGDIRVAAFIDVSAMWLVAIPLAAFFALVLRWGIFWVYVAISAEQLVKSTLGILRFRSHAWINDITRAGS
ncbi:MATE family efflux transporter [Pseudoflavonifractor sp. 524-17]|uniref:MATE family efflux transporter n=1 Tax=Pseudoflavonifractor sp. 524-17 TaxID=2304577 RepID=UPI00137B76A5|nr:MATE family efflux transporter [Pseudoflavonifractor sp. 524-17]NCE64907.1 MATE family efflux transporter [Pseudoflavonifractor sp. 524-17]